MGYNQILSRSLKAVGDFVNEATTAWADAVDEAAAGTLDAKSVLSKSVKVAQRGLTTWWSLIERADPLLPTLYIQTNASSVPGHHPGGSVFLEEPLEIDTTVTLTATSLQQVGGTGTLAVSTPSVESQSCREKITVSLAVPVTDTLGNPIVVSPGIYVGFVLADAKPFATIMARLT
jgi:hypothetical protein